MRPSLEQRLDNKPSQDIDLAPLLDVVFILLIFFIVTTVFVKETGVDVDKPKAISTQLLEKNIIMIAITMEKEVIYDGTNIGVAGVRATVAHLIRQKDKPVVIQADKLVSTDLLVKVIDQAKLGGAKKINIGTIDN